MKTLKLMEANWTEQQEMELLLSYRKYEKERTC